MLTPVPVKLNYTSLGSPSAKNAHEAAKGVSLTVIGGPAFSLVSTVVFPKTLQEATLQEIKDALLIT